MKGAARRAPRTPEGSPIAVEPRLLNLRQAAAYLGISLVPGFAGVLTRAYGLEIIVPMVFTLGLVLLALHEIALRLPRHEDIAASAPATV